MLAPVHWDAAQAPQQAPEGPAKERVLGHPLRGQTRGEQREHADYEVPVRGMRVDHDDAAWLRRPRQVYAPAGEREQPLRGALHRRRWPRDWHGLAHGHPPSAGPPAPARSTGYYRRASPAKVSLRSEDDSPPEERSRRGLRYRSRGRPRRRACDPFPQRCGCLHRERDAEGTRVTGPELSVELPIFDQGQAPTARVLAQVRQARARQAELAINIRAEVRALRNRLVVTRRSAETPRPCK